MEANQLRGGPAVDHGPLGLGGERYDATLFGGQVLPVAADSSDPLVTRYLFLLPSTSQFGRPFWRLVPEMSPSTYK